MANSGIVGLGTCPLGDDGAKSRDIWIEYCITSPSFRAYATPIRYIDAEFFGVSPDVWGLFFRTSGLAPRIVDYYCGALCSGPSILGRV